MAYGVPGATVVAHGDEVDREPAEHARAGQPLPDPLGLLGVICRA